MSTHNLCFRAKIRKNVYPCTPQFYYIKVGCKGVFITWTRFHDGMGSQKTKAQIRVQGSSFHDTAHILVYIPLQSENLLTNISVLQLQGLVLEHLWLTWKTCIPRQDMSLTCPQTWVELALQLYILG